MLVVSRRLTAFVFFFEDNAFLARLKGACPDVVAIERRPWVPPGRAYVMDSRVAADLVVQGQSFDAAPENLGSMVDTPQQYREE